MSVKEQECVNCGELTSKVHYYRIQKIKYLKLFEVYSNFSIESFAVRVIPEIDFFDNSFVEWQYKRLSLY